MTWPAAIHLLVSDDGKTYRDAGELISLDRKTSGPLPKGYAKDRTVADAVGVEILEALVSLKEKK